MQRIRSRTRGGGWTGSLIGRVLLVVAVAVLPGIASQVWSALDARQVRVLGVYAEAMRLVRLVSADQGQVAAGARELLTSLASMRSVERPGTHCQTFLTDLLPRLHGYAWAVSAGVDGAVDCAAPASGLSGNVEQTGWFHQALAHGFTAGRGTATDRDGSVLVLAQRWTDGDGRLGGVVAVALDGAWLADRLQQLALPGVVSAALLGPRGEVLATAGEAPLWRGEGSSPMTQRALQAGASQVQEVVSVGGEPYIVDTVPISAADGQLSVAVGIDREAAFAGANRAGWRDVALLLLGLVGALVLSLLGTNQMVHRPVQRLLEAATAWAGGDLWARTGVLRGPREFRRLAAAFDEMAAALQARESALSSALESTTDSVVVLDPDWRITFLNAHAAELLGSGRELLGKVLWDAFPSAATTELWSGLHGAAASGQPRHFEIFGPSLRKQLDIHAYPSTEGVTVFFRDVTEQRRAEARAAQHDGLLRAIAEAIPSLVFVTDPHGHNVYVNRRFQDYSGAPTERLLGNGWRRLMHPEDAPRVLAAWRESLERELPYESEMRLRAADGSWRWFLARGAPLRDAAGRVEYWYGMCTGIDEIVAAREAQARAGELLEQVVAERTAELRAREAELAQAQKMEAVGQLTGGVAHDFNNLLQAVSGNLELALAALSREDTPRAQRLLGNAARGISRGARLTAQLLAFSRRQILRAERVDPRRLLDDMADLLRRAAGEMVTVETESGPDLWACRADPAQLEAAVLNLVINARDAMPDGGRLRLALVNAPLDRVAAAELQVPPGDYVRVEVADTGVGMPAEVLERVFEPFYTTKEVGKGSGLGLAQVHGFLRQSGGAVRITSRPGEGTVVAMYFPRDQAGAELQLAMAEPPPRPGRGAVVLLVEDDPDVLDTLQFALIDAGFSVVPARDGADAVSVLRSDKRIDVVLSDVVLPGGISGVDVGREARRVRPGMPVLLTSGHAGDVLARRAAECEFELISKPCPQEKLLSRIAGLVAPLREAV